MIYFPKSFLAGKEVDKDMVNMYLPEPDTQFLNLYGTIPVNYKYYNIISD